jgi:thiol:disulfide interchange protein DsbA
MRNLIISAALVAASLFGMTAQAAEAPAAPYVELANPVPVAVPGKIEVVELFWYGCPHCYAFEPSDQSLGQLPSDVNFVRIPAMFGGPWDAHGQMFLTLDHGRRAQGARCGVQCHPERTQKADRQERHG